MGIKSFGRFNQIRQIVQSAEGTACISGVSESRSAAVAGIIASERKGNIVLITPSHARAQKMAEDISVFTDRSIYLLPEESRFTYLFDAKSQDALVERLAAMAALCYFDDCIVVASAKSALKKIAPRELFIESAMHLKVGEEIDLEFLKRNLSNMGYERAGFVESKGQFVIRGDIIDIFPPGETHPIRVELFDVQIDSLRSFDPLSQRSLREMQSAHIYPAQIIVAADNLLEKAADDVRRTYESFLKKAPEAGRTKLLSRQEHILESLETRTNLQLLENYIHFIYPKANYLWDYLGNEGLVIVDDPGRIADTLSLEEKEFTEDFKEMLERGEAVPDDVEAFSGNLEFSMIYKGKATIALSPLMTQLKAIETKNTLISITSKQGNIFNGKMDILQDELIRYSKMNYDIRLVCSTEERAENIKDFVLRLGLDAIADISVGTLSAGMEFPDEKLVIISDSDIFLTSKQKRTKKDRGSAKSTKAFFDIAEGDYIVHENHGIGRFEGIVQLRVQDIKKDYLKIKYAGKDLLYIPVENMDVVQRYVGSDSAKPKVNKLAGGDWSKTKQKAKKAIMDMAEELVKLSAERKMEKGYAFSKDTLWQGEFESLFPFEETQDQLRAIEEIKEDMEQPIPMDRLLCGDVGYGKTEVAARAVFKCIADGKQAAILVPTTLLANQHCNTFKERFENFPFNVDMLSRFRTETQQKNIIAKVVKGEIDVLIGTHRLLSKDVVFKDLGLLIIDEEQHFGVMHKEKIKEMRKNVDVLTLSATPIPRTLHMSLMGIRDMSLIEEPPENRYPVQTYVMEQEDTILKEAIEKEIDRGGQVYVVYNRVRGIQRISAHIKELVHSASILTTHGQMDEKLIEDNMLKFVNNECNVLVSTTIIESGLDIPNANTIIILDADRFGLSQLYQLRGRVGRSNKMAYAYLMYQKDKILSEVAEKRLRAIREFTEFGAGFHIAMRDLEIRGAGNILGTKQHGHMITIGYELYCKLVEDAVRGLSGSTEERKEEVEVSIELPVEAYIPASYIFDEVAKLHMYKKIASIRDYEDRNELIDELIDRFGEIPKETLNLIEVSLIKSLAEKNGVRRVRQELGKLIFDYEDLALEKIASVSKEYGSNLFVHGGRQPYIRLNPAEKNRLKEVVGFLTKLSQ